MFRIRISPGSLPGSVEDLSEPLKKAGTSLSSLFNRLTSKMITSSNTPPVEIPLEEMPKARILREYFETRSKGSPLPVGNGLGIQNQANSCAIGSLLFNICSMYGNIAHFQEIFTLNEDDTEEAQKIKYALMDITNHLENPYDRGCVQGFKLESIRNMVMSEDTKKAVFLDPDEFITALFKKLNIPFGNRFVKIAPNQDQIPKSTKPVSIQELIDNIHKNFPPKFYTNPKPLNN